jgi:hypothetical protein
MPDKDPRVAGFFHASETAFKNPKSLAEVFCREAERFWGNSLVNTKPDATYHLDLRLLTSASPKAANNLRRLAKNTLINALGQK